MGMGYPVDFKNKIVLALKCGEDISDMITDGKPRKDTIKTWYDTYKKEGLYVEKSNNDAIPSWSGYNYQGKMMLLLTLQIINKLFECEDENIEQWDVELEKKQDFVFRKNNVVQFLYQVKACLSKTTVKGYEKALEKLIEDKECTNNDNAKCILISAENITDWDSKENKYKDSVELYKYRDQIVSISDVVENIKMEVEILLGRIEVNVPKDDIYFILCDLIDRKISQCHTEGKKSNYNIFFCDIIKDITDIDITREEAEKSRFKEQIYEYIIDVITKDTKDQCEECVDDCVDSCGVLRNYELTKAVALDEYIRYINPIASKEEPLEGIFSNNTYTDNICEVYKAVNPQNISEENNLISFSYNSEDLKIIPTLISIKDIARRTSKNLVTINQNEAYKSIASEFVLSGNIGSRILQTQKDKFTNSDIDYIEENNKIVIDKTLSIKEVLDSTKKRDRKISFSENITIINKDDLVMYLIGGNN